MPASVLVLFGLLLLVLLAAVRFAVHLLYERPVRGYRARSGARSVLIVGAGDGGRLLLREILRNPDLNLRPVGFVDDDPRKQGVRVDRGLDVLGTTAELDHVLEDVEPDEVLIAIPSAPGTLRARVVMACRERGVAVRTMPTVFELLQTRRRPLHPPGPRGARGGRARPRARADGHRGERRLPHRPLRDRDRRRAARSAPSCAARSRAWARAGSSCSTTPRTTCSRSSASWSRTGTR